MLRELFAGLGKLGRGVSGRVATRGAQLNEERDQARAESERWQRNWQATYVYTGRLEHKLAVNGIDFADVPPPVFEETITPAQLRAIKEGTSP